VSPFLEFRDALAERSRDLRQALAENQDGNNAEQENRNKGGYGKKHELPHILNMDRKSSKGGRSAMKLPFIHCTPLPGMMTSTQPKESAVFFAGAESGFVICA
jgi:hypothetical protein